MLERVLLACGAGSGVGAGGVAGASEYGLACGVGTLSGAARVAGIVDADS